MICKLCQKLVPKLVNSHIIPEFMYQGMYDEKHRFFGLSLNPKIRERIYQKGVREPLLCEHCDNVLVASYEKYASGLIYGGVAHRSATDGNDLRLQDLDYAKVRLFYLSLLWRMGVSTDEFFSDVSLGPYQEKLRSMIVGEDPGEPDECGLMCVAPLFDQEHLGDWIMAPDCVRYGGRRIHRCIIGGLLYCFFVGKAALPQPLVERFVQRDGSWVIRREKIENIPFLRNWCIEMGAAMAHRSEG